MSIRLNERDIIAKVFNNIPSSSMELVLRSLPSNYLGRFIRFLSTELETTTRLEFALRAVKALLNNHGRYIQQQRIKASVVSGGINNHVNLQASLRALIRAFNERQETLSKICNENKYALEYLISFRGGKKDILAGRQTTDKTEDIKEVLQKGVFVNK
jgi:periodic tryptophan protein 2